MSNKKASFPRSCDYTKTFHKDWQRLNRSYPFDSFSANRWYKTKHQLSTLAFDRSETKRVAQKVEANPVISNSR